MRKKETLMKSSPKYQLQVNRKIKMANYITLFSILASISLLIVTLVPFQTDSYYLKKKEIKALKKVAIAATVLGQRKKLMIPLPVPLPVPIPIIHKHEPIISPIDPLLTLSYAKGAKGFGGGGGFGYGGLHGGLGGLYRKRR